MRLYPAISIVTLGVLNIERATRFYEALGWRRSAGASTEAISFFSLNNLVLALFGENALVKDSGLVPQQQEQRALQPDAIKPPRIVLAQNYPSETAVRQAMDEAVNAGGRQLVAPETTFWGGYHGVFADPDGHVWELAFNPFFPLAPDGSVDLPE